MIKQLTINSKQFGFKASTKREQRGANSMALLIKATDHGKFWQEEGQPELVRGEIRGIKCYFFYGKGQARIDGVMLYSWHQISQEIRSIEKDYEDDNFDVLDDG